MGFAFVKFFHALTRQSINFIHEGVKLEFDCVRKKCVQKWSNKELFQHWNLAFEAKVQKIEWLSFMFYQRFVGIISSIQPCDVLLIRTLSNPFSSTWKNQKKSIYHQRLFYFFVFLHYENSNWVVVWFFDERKCH